MNTIKTIIIITYVYKITHLLKSVHLENIKLFSFKHWFLYADQMLCPANV